MKKVHTSSRPATFTFYIYYFTFYINFTFKIKVYITFLNMPFILRKILNPKFP